MFGKTTNPGDVTTFDGPTIEDFFGDETAAAEAVQINGLRDRVAQVESQISSQFTSLATYAQIAQEQIELARSEAKATTIRSEHRLTELIERERADRIQSITGTAQSGSMPDVTARLDALEHNVAQIRRTLDGCFAQQKALAEAINALFERWPLNDPEKTAAEPVTNTAEPIESPPQPAAFASPASAFATAEPIAGLSLRLSIDNA